MKIKPIKSKIIITYPNQTKPNQAKLLLVPPLTKPTQCSQLISHTSLQLMVREAVILLNSSTPRVLSVVAGVQAFASPCLPPLLLQLVKKAPILPIGTAPPKQARAPLSAVVADRRLTRLLVNVIGIDTTIIELSTREAALARDHCGRQ